MNQALSRLTWLVTARPWVTIFVLLLTTVVLAAGAERRAPVVEGAVLAFLPPGHPIAEASNEIDELFGDSGEVTVVTIIFRGNAFTPEGLAQMDALTWGVLADAQVEAVLAPGESVIAPSLLVREALQVDSFESVTQAQINSALGSPEIEEVLAAMTASDADGNPVAIATVRLSDADERKVADAERRINELTAGNVGPLRVSSVSPVVVEAEYRDATESGMLPLIALALGLVASLILLFLRTLADLLLTLLGLFVALIWVVGAEGWLGPHGLGWIGPPSSHSAMVPIIVISLTVDYAIQTVSSYREQRTAGLPVADAIGTGLGHVAIPLMLAAVTTIASLLTNLFSPIGAVGDFGIVAGLGVGLSLIVILTLLPAGRMIIDRRREQRATLAPPRPVSSALPGVRRAAELLGTSVTRRPAPFILVVLAITVGLGFAAARLETGFDIRDILPRGGTVLEDIETLEAFGGSTEMASVLVKAEATDTRTYLNLNDLRVAFEDDRLRPQAAAGPIHTSYELLVHDWTHDSGEEGDKYDAGLAELFRHASVGLRLNPVLLQELLDRLKAKEPALVSVLADNPDGIDSLLFQFPTFSGDPEATRALQQDIEALWREKDVSVTVTSLDVVSVAVTDEITRGQTAAISTTIAVAIGVLAIFFWVTLRQPALAFIAVVPVVLALICVLGTMALLDIPYNLITSIITALSIGIGVDYTIHIIHRYREEFARSRSPEQAAVSTLATIGSALLGSALTTALGLGVLVFSPLLASQQFGITAAITIAYSLVISILLVPPAMTVWGSYQNMRLRSMVERTWAELDVAIEDAYQRHGERAGLA